MAIFLRYDQYFYEVKAGMLRRNSTSPYEQISNVTEIINNEHELALLRLATPLHLNRYIKENGVCALIRNICLAEHSTI